VRLNTDALDNSAGVSTSDHEVNIKILLTAAEREGSLTRVQRDTLLAEMTEEVGTLVLADNHAQSLALSLEVMTAAADLPAHAALMRRLEQEGLLDRAVAGLPDAAAIRVRLAAGEGLTRPELAALLPFAKLWLTEAIEHSALPTAPALAPLLVAYFPHPLRTRFASLIPRHRLRRELVATSLANGVANRLGVAALARLAGSAGKAAGVARAAWIAESVFGLDAAAASIDAAPAPVGTRLAALAALRRLQEGAARDLLLAPDATLEDALAALAPGIAALVAAEIATPGEATRVLLDAGIPEGAAALAGAAPRLAAAPAMVRLAAAAGVAPDVAAEAWAATGEAYALDALRNAAEVAPAPSAFAARAKVEALAELAALQARLAEARLAGTALPGSSAATLARDAALEGGLLAVGVALRGLAAQA